MNEPSPGAVTRSILPVSGEYALRAAACLAALPPEGALTARELATLANVPPAFLAKVLRRLVLHGLLEGHKGHHGGFRLARAPGTIRVLDVLTAAGVTLAGAHCAFGFDHCDAARPCPLHDIYTDLQHTCHTWARANTLADIDPTRIPSAPR